MLRSLYFLSGDSYLQINAVRCGPLYVSGDVLAHSRFSWYSALAGKVIDEIVREENKS